MPNLPLVLHRDGTSTIKWWANGSHGTHSNYKEHSGHCMTLGSSMVISSLIKQKLNTRSFTKTELVAADDFMPILLWTNNFLGCKTSKSAKQFSTKTTKAPFFFRKMANC